MFMFVNFYDVSNTEIHYHLRSMKGQSKLLNGYNIMLNV